MCFYFFERHHLHLPLLLMRPKKAKAATHSCLIYRIMVFSHWPSKLPLLTLFFAAPESKNDAKRKRKSGKQMTLKSSSSQTEESSKAAKKSEDKTANKYVFKKMAFRLQLIVLIILIMQLANNIVSRDRLHIARIMLSTG